MSKKALVGFRAARYWPITANDATTYTTGAMQAFVGARNLTKDDNESEYIIPGDDSVYDTGTDYNYQDMEFEVDELSLEMHAALKGYEYDEEENSYIRKADAKAIQFALGYAAPLAGGSSQFRMWKHYCCTVLKVKVDHRTRVPGQNKEANTYKLTIRNTMRAADGKIEHTKDGTIDWLNTIDNLPAEGGS
ncbi:MAG: major tail protein [Burkholderiales bacterium]